MSVQEMDISWDVLRRIVRDWAGSTAELDHVNPLVGGCINTTLALTTTDGRRAVLKVTPHRVNRDLEREAYQLNLLKSYDLPVPEVYACNVGSLSNPDSYLLLEFIDGVSLAEARKQATPDEYDHLQMHLADLVLAMHGHTGRHYRRIDPASEAEFDSWPAFYRHVYDPIWHEVEKDKQLPVKVRKQITKMHGRLDRLIAHDDQPRLVHWDIWATNILARRDEHGKWQVSGLLDPNCKYAHIEAEIAYMELFNTITPAFMRAYQQTRRLPPEYAQVRKLVYQVYPLINHVRLFGHKYLQPLAGAVEKLSAVV